MKIYKFAALITIIILSTVICPPKRKFERNQSLTSWRADAVKKFKEHSKIKNLKMKIFKKDYEQSEIDIDINWDDELYDTKPYNYNSEEKNNNKLEYQLEGNDKDLENSIIEINLSSSIDESILYIPYKGLEDKKNKIDHFDQSLVEISISWESESSSSKPEKEEETFKLERCKSQIKTGTICFNFKKEQKMIKRRRHH
jgi:hypothetical protein